jgi:membrane-associated protease RseP (regulator of RpoE activity)
VIRRPSLPLAPLAAIAACAVMFAGALGAAEAPAAPANATAAAPAGAPTVKPSLGIKIDTTSGNFDNGLPVTDVLPGGTADTIGMQVGDLIRTIDGTPVKQVDDVLNIINKAKVGDPIDVGVARGPKADLVGLKGVLLVKPPLRSTQVQINEIEHKFAEASKRAAHDPSLPELLNALSDKLGDLQRDLPKAAERFRQQYPKGRFRVKIVIDIASDTTAPDPVEIGVGDDDATASATATGPAPK